MSIDTNNIDPNYWEEVLAEHLLDEERLGLIDEPSNEGSDLTEVRNSVARRASKTNPDFDILRTKLDGDDPFMTSGHQITKAYNYKRKNSEWATDDLKVRALIDAAFPAWREYPRTRARAARWARIIYLYYRANMSCPMVAEEMRIDRKRVENALVGINRVVRGLRYDNRGPRRTRVSKPPMQAVRES